MISLGYSLKEEEIEVAGKICTINLFFDNIIRLFDMFDDDTIDEDYKFVIAFEMLVKCDDKQIDSIDFDTKFETVKNIMESYILPKDYKKKTTGGPEKLYDIKQDSAYIYSSFIQEYGINLFEQYGKLRWEEFNALLQGMRDDTKIKEIMNIRGTKIPVETKYNKDEVRNLKAKKRFYALKKTEVELEEALNAMFSKLTR